MAIDISPPDPIQLNVTSIGAITLRRMSLSSVVKLQGLRETVTDPRDFAARAIHLHLVKPSHTLKRLASLSDEALSTVCSEWAEHPSTLGVTLDPNDVFESFQTAFDEYLTDQTARIRDSFGTVFQGLRIQTDRLASQLAINDSFKSILEDARWSQKAWQEMIQTSLRPATLGMEELVRSLQPALDNSRLLSSLTAAAVERKEILDFYARSPMLTESIRLASTHESFVRSIATSLGSQQRIASRLATGLASLTDGARKVLDSWRLGIAVPEARFEHVLAAPATEVVRASAVAAAALGAPRAEPEAASSLAFDPLLALKSVGDDLILPYQGALAAIHGGGTDAARHFAVSARELLTHTLHRLAPDEELRRWPGATPADFPNNRPTRRIRLRYILRRFDSGMYAQFIQDDVNKTLELLDLLNSDTHRLDARHDPETLRMFLRRTEGVLAILIEAGTLAQP